jgi:hypothetical protein
MPRLLIRKGEGEGKDHALSGVCIVGRHASANFVLGDQLVSRNHFRVLSEGGAWYVEDLGSTNGTIVNGRRSKKTQLADGDVIVAGTTELQFVQKDLLGGAPVRPAVPAEPVAAVAPPPAAVPAQPAVRPAIPAIPRAPAPVAPAAPTAAPRPAVPVAARPAAAAPAKPAPAPAPAPAKPPIQAPVPTKKRR